MVFMDEYEMPSIFERCDRNLPVHVQFKDETGEKEIDFRFAFVEFIDALFRRVTFGPRRRVIHHAWVYAARFLFFVARVFSTIARAYAAILRDELRSGMWNNRYTRDIEFIPHFETCSIR